MQKANEQTVPRLYDIMHNVGRVKYVLKTQDGIKTHKDGSMFWDIYTFKCKKRLLAKIKELKQQGYREKNYPIC